MCFRPAEMDTLKPINCPNCGKKIRPTNGLFPSKCPFCKYEADFEDIDFEDEAAAPAVARTVTLPRMTTLPMPQPLSPFPPL